MQSFHRNLFREKLKMRTPKLTKIPVYPVILSKYISESSVPSVATNKKCKTNPIYSLFSPKTTIVIKNEPNLCKTNPIQTNRLLSWPAVRMLSTYSGQALRKKCCASSSLRPILGVPRTTAYRLQATNKKMRNEPNLKNTKININPVKIKSYIKNGVFAPRKNEPNLSRRPVHRSLSPAKMEPNFKLWAGV